MTDQTETECLDIAAMTKLAQDFIAELKTLADARRDFFEAHAAREASEDTEDEAYVKLRKACRNFIRANPEDGFMGNACDHVAHGYTVVKSRRRTVERLEQKGVDELGRYTEQRELELAWYDLDEATAELGNLLGGYKSGLAVKGLHDAYRYFAREAKVVSDQLRRRSRTRVKSSSPRSSMTFRKSLIGCIAPLRGLRMRGATITGETIIRSPRESLRRINPRQILVSCLRKIPVEK